MRLGSKRVLMLLCAVASSFVCLTASAFGAETHLFEEGFGSGGTSATFFERPAAVAVDESTGGIYVGDAFADDTVQKFNMMHEPEPFTGISEVVKNGELTGFHIHLVGQVAVDAGSGDLYVVGGSESVRAFEADGEPFEFTAGPDEKRHELVGTDVCGVAVDSNGAIYVSEFNVGISVYAHDGELLTKIPLTDACNLAVGPEGVVYASMLANPEAGSSGPVQKLVPGPSQFPVNKSTSYSVEGLVDGNPSYTVAVDPATGYLYVDEGSQVAEYDKNGARVGSFGSGTLADVSGYGAGLAVNGVSGKVYVAQGNFGGQVDLFGPSVLLPDVTTGQASKISPKGTVTLNGAVNPDGVTVTGCQFEYGETEAYGQRVACNTGDVGSGTTEVAVTAELAGLKPGVTYHFHLRASNAPAEANKAFNFGDDQTFVMPPRPEISTASTSDLTARSVDFSAEINPGGLVTSCRLEYGESSNYGKSLPCEPASLEGSTDVLVKGHVEDLEPETPLKPNVTYHWRVVATNEAGTTEGADHTFIYDTSGEGLPDNRAYEMVTPAHKDAAAIGFVFNGLQFGISEGGSRMIMSSIQCFGDARSCEASRGLTGTPFLFSRTSAGWVAHALAPPAGSFEANTAWAISPSEGMALFSMPTPPMFEDDFYRGPVNGSYQDIGAPTPPADGPLNTAAPWDSVAYEATSNFSRVVFDEKLNEKPLWSFDGTTGGLSVYELCAEGCVSGLGTPVLVGVSDEGQGDDLISRCGTGLGSGSGHSFNPGALSADGEIVFFTALGCSEGTGSNAGAGHSVPANELFARVDGLQAGAHTVAISEPSSLAAEVAPYGGCRLKACVENVNNKANWRSATLYAASSDGSKVFFGSAQQLTDSAQQDAENLYVYDFAKPVHEEGLPAGSLVDISAGDKSGLGSRVEGVVAISADGSHAYFVAKGVLTEKANAQGEMAKQGLNNLYVWSSGGEGDPEGQVSFIASLPEADSRQWSEGDNPPFANVTPDGRFLVFESHGALTPDDTRSDGAVQIFRYDAQTGQLVRISVGKQGFNDNGNTGVGNAAIAPPEGPPELRLDPSMSNDGRFVFFESPIGLTPHALDDVQIGGSPGEPVFAENVYEWHEGKVYLISDGRDVATRGSGISAVSLFGSDGTGDNVFFMTADSLVPQDTDTGLDIYDARICRPDSPCVSSPPEALPPCFGEECHGIPGESLRAPAGGSATLGGTGNVSPGVKMVKKTKQKRRLVRCSHRGRHRGVRCVRHRKRVGVRGRAGRKGVGR